MMIYFLLLILCVFNIYVGYQAGYIRGRLQQRPLEEEDEKNIYLAGWREGLFHSLGEYNEEIYLKIQRSAIASYMEYKGYPHNRKH